MDFLGYVWLGVTVLAVVAEAATFTLVSIWFVPGAVIAFAACLLGAPIWLQILLFAGISLLALLLTRPLVEKFQKKGKTFTNADRVLGCTAVVTYTIDNIRGEGQVLVMGNSWSARASEKDGVIPEGATVLVERIEGVKLIVSLPKATEEPESN